MIMMTDDDTSSVVVHVTSATITTHNRMPYYIPNNIKVNVIVVNIAHYWNYTNACSSLEKCTDFRAC